MLSKAGVSVNWRIRLVLIVSLFISSMLPASLATAAPPAQTDSVDELWLDISLGPPLVDWFNRVARPHDIARIERVREINLLDEISTGRKLVVFKSIREAEEALPHIADRIDIVGYNLESGSFNLPEEQANPVDSVKRMYALARKYDLLLAFGPDHELAVSDGIAVAPYVDIFVLQVQRVQTQPDRVLSFVLPLIPQLRRANPDVQISVQIRTEGDVVEIVDLIDAINGQLNGVSILTSPETVDIAEALVNELQARDDAVSNLVMAAPTASPPAVKIDSGFAPPSTQEEPPGLSCPLMVVGAFIAGGLGGGVTATLICAARRGGNRTTAERL